MTLVEFLLARIAEDEAAVRGAMHLGCVEDTSDGPDVVHGVLCVNRVLVKCAADRRLIEFVDLDQDAPWVLRYLALPYADHPDYRQEWAP